MGVLVLLVRLVLLVLPQNESALTYGLLGRWSLTFIGTGWNWARIVRALYASVGSVGFEFLERSLEMTKKLSKAWGFTLAQAAWLRGYKGYIKRIKGKVAYRATKEEELSKDRIATSRDSE